jgi:hypothetical protein
LSTLVRFFIALTLLLGLDVRFCMADITEGQIKTAYVFNFIKFTDWPAGVGADDKVTLCVVGSNALDGTLATLNDRKAGDRKLQVVHYNSADSNLSSCQVVFIGESEHSSFISIIQSLRNSPVLTISDIDDFAEKDGCIGLRYRENKVVFEVNLTSVQRSKLRLPGQLLNLASKVFGK